MAVLEQRFRHDEVEDDDCLPVLTAGMQVIESSINVNKKNTGKVMNLTIEILDGPAASRRFWLHLNYIHENSTAQEISARTLKQITSAIGIEELTDTEDMHFKPFTGTTSIEKNTGDFPDRNGLKKAVKFGSAPAGASAARPGPGPSTRPGPAAAQRPATVAARPGPGSDPAARPWGAKQPAATDIDDQIPF